MQAKTYLEQVAKAERELIVLGHKKRHFEDLARSVGGMGGSAIGSQHNGGSRVETAAVNLADLITETAAQEKEYARVVHEAEELISKVPQERFRQILRLHYIAGCSFRTISDELRYEDPKSVHRAHRWALREMNKVLREVERNDETS